MKLIIEETCIGPKGAILSRGQTVEVEAPTAMALIGAGRAVAPDSERGKNLSKLLESEVTGEAPAKAPAKK